MMMEENLYFFPWESGVVSFAEVLARRVMKISVNYLWKERERGGKTKLILDEVDLLAIVII